MDLVGVQGRGQSEVLGLVLLFALVVSVTAAVVVVGGQAINDAQDSTSQASAEQTMLELQSKADQSSGGSTQEVSFAETGGGSGVQAADGRARVEESDSVSVDPDAGKIRIEVEAADGSTYDSGYTDLGTVTYREGSEELAYQGGGVFRKSDDSAGSVIVSPPKFSYRYEDRAPTLSLGVTKLSTSGEDVGDGFDLQQGGSTQAFPSSSISNPLGDGDEVTITVESEFYRAWATLFDERTGVSVDTGDFNGNGEQEARVNLDGTPGTTTTATGAIVTSDVDELSFDNHAFVDSYESPSTDPPSYESEAPVYVNGIFTPSNHVYVDGDLNVRDRASITSSADSSPRSHVEGRTIIGGSPGDGKPTEIDGNTWFKDVFSTEDDLKAVGKSHHSDERVKFAGPVYVGGDVTKLQDAKVEGDLHARGDVDIYDDVKITGDVIAGGDVTFDGGADNVKIEGEVNAGDDVTIEGDASPTIVGGTNDGSSVDPHEPITPELPTLSPVSGEISSTRERIDGNNDNGGNIDDIETEGGCDPSCTLSGSAGGSDYYIEDGISLTKEEELVLDTHSGPITIYSGSGGDNAAVYLRGGEIKVRGANPVTIYNGGDLELTNANTGKNAKIRTYDAAGSRTYRAPNMQIYMHPSAKAGLNNGEPAFTGVIRGPHATDGTDITVTNGAIVHGALIGEITHINEDARIHFDAALLDGSPPDIGPDNADSTVTYLQVTSTEVELGD